MVYKKGPAYRVRPVKEICEDIEEARRVYGDGVRFLFFPAGNTIAMPTEDLSAVCRFAAEKLHQNAVIYMPKGAARSRVENIQSHGATVIVTDLNYDETVRLCRRKAEENGWYVIQDTAWEGYAEIPLWIMQGYMTMCVEALNQMVPAGLACGEPNPMGWRILRDFCSCYVSCDDFAAANGVRILANPLKGDAPVEAGESGAVGLGVLDLLCNNESFGELKQKLVIGPDSILLFFNTEGATDPVSYREILWHGKYPSLF